MFAQSGGASNRQPPGGMAAGNAIKDLADGA